MTCGTIEDMKKLKLMGGGECLVDDADFEWMSRLNWKLRPDGYVQVSSFNLLHRLVVRAPKGMDVHHTNDNKLDNRADNLQVLTPSEHQQHHFHRIVAFQKAHQKFPDTKKCVVCGDEFQVNPRKRSRNKCCSDECAMKMRIAGRQRQVRLSRKSQSKS